MEVETAGTSPSTDTARPTCPTSSPPATCPASSRVLGGRHAGRQVAAYVVGGHTVAHRHPNYDSAPSAIFTDPEIADVGLAEADAFAEGRKIRVTKVPLRPAQALIDNDPRFRQDHHRPGHRHHPGRVHRRPQCLRADLRTGRGGHGGCGPSTSWSPCWSTRRWPRPSPKQRSEPATARGSSRRALWRAGILTAHQDHPQPWSMPTRLCGSSSSTTRSLPTVDLHRRHTCT